MFLGRFVTLVVAGALAGFHGASADASLLRAELADSTPLALQAPAQMTRALLVTNASAETCQVRESVILPQGWRSFISDSLFALAPSAHDVRLICAAIPARTPPGDYQVVYEAQRIGFSQTITQLVFSVIILQTYCLEASVKRVPPRLASGQDYQAEFSVTNKSNGACPVTLSALSSAGLPVELSYRSGDLQPGEVRTVTALVKGERNRMSGRTNVLRLDVETPGRTRTSAAATTEILPVSGLPVDVYHRLSSRAILRWVGSRDAGTMQVEGAGEGALDEQGKYLLEYLVRGPHNLEDNVLGLRDEVYLKLHSPSLDARLGDQFFSLSHLTARSTLGRGVTASFGQGNRRAGAYAFETRGHVSGEKQAAFFASYAPTNNVQAQLNVLRQTLHDQTRSMASIATHLKTGYDASVDWESAVGQSVETEHKGSLAHRVLLRSRIFRAQISAEGVHADRDFSGSNRNADLAAVSMNMPLNRHWQCSATLHWLAENLHHPIPNRISMRERFAQTVFSRVLNSRSSVALNIEDLSRIDLTPNTGTRSHELTTVVRFRQTLKSWSWQGFAGGGRWQSSTETRARFRERFGGGLTFQPSSLQTYSASFQSGFAGAAVGARRNNIVHLAAQYNVLTRLSLALNVQRSGFGGISPYENDQIALDVSCRLPGNHILTFRFRQLEFHNHQFPDSKAFLFSYEVPVGIPLARKSGMSVVRGRITRGDRAEVGVPNVLLTMDGSSVLSDRNGRFVFANVKPGTHFLQADRASLGQQNISVPRTPLIIETRDKKTEHVQLSVVPGATVRGRIMLFRTTGGVAAHRLGLGHEAGDSTTPDTSLAWVPLGCLAGVHLLLRGGDQVFTGVTDASGRFEFGDLTPGRWELVCDPSTLPPFHEAEQKQYVFSVAAGEEAAVMVRVLPKSRPLIIVDEGKVPVISVSRR